MIISFYNIASSLTHLNDLEEANRLYKEGYYLGQKILGSKHKLTIMLKSIVKPNKKKEKDDEKEALLSSELNHAKSNRSLNKSRHRINP